MMTSPRASSSPPSSLENDLFPADAPIGGGTGGGGGGGGGASHQACVSRIASERAQWHRLLLLSARDHDFRAAVLVLHKYLRLIDNNVWRVAGGCATTTTAAAAAAAAPPSRIHWVRGAHEFADRAHLNLSLLLAHTAQCFVAILSSPSFPPSHTRALLTSGTVLRVLVYLCEWPPLRPLVYAAYMESLLSYSSNADTDGKVPVATLVEMLTTAHTKDVRALVSRMVRDYQVPAQQQMLHRWLDITPALLRDHADVFMPASSPPSAAAAPPAVVVGAAGIDNKHARMAATRVLRSPQHTDAMERVLVAWWRRLLQASHANRRDVIRHLLIVLHTATAPTTSTPMPDTTKWLLHHLRPLVPLFVHAMINNGGGDGDGDSDTLYQVLCTLVVMYECTHAVSIDLCLAVHHPVGTEFERRLYDTRRQLIIQRHEDEVHPVRVMVHQMFACATSSSLSSSSTAAAAAAVRWCGALLDHARRYCPRQVTRGVEDALHDMVQQQQQQHHHHQSPPRWVLSSSTMRATYEHALSTSIVTWQRLLSLYVRWSLHTDAAADTEALGVCVMDILNAHKPATVDMRRIALLECVHGLCTLAHAFWHQHQQQQQQQQRQAAAFTRAWQRLSARVWSASLAGISDECLECVFRSLVVAYLTFDGVDLVPPASIANTGATSTDGGDGWWSHDYEAIVDFHIQFREHRRAFHTHSGDVDDSNNVVVSSTLVDGLRSMQGLVSTSLVGRRVTLLYLLRSLRDTKHHRHRRPVFVEDDCAANPALPPSSSSSSNSSLSSSSMVQDGILTVLHALTMECGLERVLCSVLHGTLSESVVMPYMPYTLHTETLENSQANEVHFGLLKVFQHQPSWFALVSLACSLDVDGANLDGGGGGDDGGDGGVCALLKTLMMCIVHSWKSILQLAVASGGGDDDHDDCGQSATATLCTVTRNTIGVLSHASMLPHPLVCCDVLVDTSVGVTHIYRLVVALRDVICAANDGAKRNEAVRHCMHVVKRIIMDGNAPASSSQERMFGLFF